MAVAAAMVVPFGTRRWCSALTALSLAELRNDRDLSLTGVFKWVLEPLSHVAVYVVLVDVIFGRGTPHYPLFVLCAVLPWQFFQGVITGSMSLVQRHGPVIGNCAFPLTVLPASLVVKEGSTFVVSVLVFLPIAGLLGAKVSFSLLCLPLIAAVLVLLAAGPAFLGGLFGVYFPDFRVIAINLSRLCFLASTALVRPAEVPGDVLPDLLRLNPLSGIFNALRRVLMDGRPPAAGDLLWPAAVAIVFLGVGLPLYVWRQREFAKEL